MTKGERPSPSSKATAGGSSAAISLACASLTLRSSPAVRPAAVSDPGVPGVAAVLPIAAAPAGDPREIVDRLDVHDVFRHLVAELVLDPQAQRRAVGHRQGGAVHRVGEDGLLVERIDEI